MRHSALRRSVAVAVGLVACLVVASVAVGSASVKNPTYNLKKLRGSIVADGSSTVGPYTQATAELFRRAGASNVKVTVGISGTGGGFSRFCRGETDLSDASRPMRTIRGEAVPGQRRPPVERVHRRERRADGRRQQAEHVGALPVGGRAQEDLGARLAGGQLERRSPGLPRRSDPPVRPGNGLGDVRVLHRGDQREGSREPHGLPGLRGRQRARAGSRRRARRRWATSATRTSSRTERG